MKITNFHDLGLLKVAGVTSGTTSTPPTAGVTDHGALTGLTDDDHTQYVRDTHGGVETSHDLGSLGATETLNLANGNEQHGILNANCTVGFTGWTTGSLCRFEVELTEDGTGGWTPTFTGVTWLGGTTPTHDTTAGTTSLYVFWSRDGGTTIVGAQAGAAAAAALTIEDEGTPLATAAETLDFVGAGVTATGAGAEKTITIPGITEAGVRDIGHWEVIVAGTAPPVAVSNPADDDWLYGWVTG